MGLKRAPAMEEAREDFPPVPLPFFPPNAAPARLVRVPFKPSLGQKCQQLWEVPLSQTKRILKFLQKKVDWSPEFAEEPVLEPPFEPRAAPANPFKVEERPKNTNWKLT